jgi:large subunit ribosomal protein L22
MEAKAIAKNLRGSAQKARLVIDMIRGRKVPQALAILQFTNKRAAPLIYKVLWSAVHNAKVLAEKQNILVDEDELWVKACHVDIGRTKYMRRTRPAPQGRAYREQRHLCHVTVMVSSDAPVTVDAETVQSGKSARGAGKATAATLDQKAPAARKRGGAAAAPRAKKTAAPAKPRASTKVSKTEQEASEE